MILGIVLALILVPMIAYAVFGTLALLFFGFKESLASLDFVGALIYGVLLLIVIPMIWDIFVTIFGVFA